MPGHGEGDRGGLGGAGHRRAGAVRRGAPASCWPPTPIVIGDTGNFRVGLPTVTATLRGMTLLRVQVDTLGGQPALGPVRRRRPRRAGRADPRAGLAARRGRLDDGRRAGRGRAAGTGCSTRRTEFRKDAKVLDGVELIGSGTVADRHLGAPGRHRARHRLPAGGRRDPVRAGERAGAGQPAGAAGRGRGRRRPSCSIAHLESHAPWGARVDRRSRSARASRSARTPPARRTRRWPRRCASRTTAQEMQIAGQGGSIPLCNTLASLYPRGGDPADRAERAGGADPRGERERVARGAGAAVGRRGAVPAQRYASSAA